MQKAQYNIYINSPGGEAYKSLWGSPAIQQVLCESLQQGETIQFTFKALHFVHEVYILPHHPPMAHMYPLLIRINLIQKYTTLACISFYLLKSLIILIQYTTITRNSSVYKISFKPSNNLNKSQSNQPQSSYFNNSFFQPYLKLNTLEFLKWGSVYVLFMFSYGQQCRSLNYFIEITF